MARWYSEIQEYSQMTKEEKDIRDKIVEIMSKHTMDMSNSHFHGSEYGIREDDYEDVADEIMKEFKIK